MGKVFGKWKEFILARDQVMLLGKKLEGRKKFKNKKVGGNFVYKFVFLGPVVKKW